MCANVLNQLRLVSRLKQRQPSQSALFLDLCGVRHGCAALFRTFRLAGVWDSVPQGLHQGDSLPIDRADFEEQLSDLKTHPVNIVHAHPRLAIHSKGLDEILRKKTNVAYWNDIVPFLDGGAIYDEPYDEIWVPSEFMARMVRSRTSLPVQVFPYAIDPTSLQSSRMTRADLGIDSKDIVFLARVDLRTPIFFSCPEAAIEAFREAFPHGNSSRARMILLVENPDQDHAAVRRLQAAAGCGLKVIARNFTDDEARSLLQAADVYVSLHRFTVEVADILEAMAAGVSVIATGFSANMDFMDERSGLLCRFRKRLPTVEEAREVGVFVKPEFEIAEPERRHAATLMRELADSALKRKALQSLGRRAAEKATDPKNASRVLQTCIGTTRLNKSDDERGDRSLAPTLWWVGKALDLLVVFGLLPFFILGSVTRLFGGPRRPEMGIPPWRDGFETLFRWADRITLSSAPSQTVPKEWRRFAQGPAAHMLVLTPYVPAPDTYGGGVTIWNNWRSFREIYPNVSLTVLYFCMQPEDLRSTVLRWTLRLGVVHVFYNQNCRETSPRFNFYPRHFRPWLAKAAALRIVTRDLRQHPDSVFVAETILCAPYFPPDEFDCPRVLVLHDDFQKTFRQFGKHLPRHRIDQKWIFMIAWFRMRQLHAFALGAFDCTAFLSEEDARTLGQNHRLGSTACFPLSIDCRRIRSQSSCVAVHPRRIAFVGFFPYWPNVSAVEWIMKQVFPTLQLEFPDAEFHVFGSEPPESWSRLAPQNPGLVVRGFQPELYRMQAECEVVVNPLFEGTGTRTKLLEAFALGKAVVSTSIGARGVDVCHERDCLIADTAEDFIAAISRLFRDSRLRDMIGENARQLADRHDGLRVVSSFWSEFQISVGRSTRDEGPRN